MCSWFDSWITQFMTLLDATSFQELAVTSFALYRSKKKNTTKIIFWGSFKTFRQNKVTFEI